MDVAKTTDDYLIPMNVFDRLFETRPVSGASEVVKSLVTDYSVSEDGLTYSFTLREGVVFSNGSALTASDVQFSFERLLKEAKENTEIPLEILGGEAVMNGKPSYPYMAGFSGLKIRRTWFLQPEVQIYRRIRKCGLTGRCGMSDCREAPVFKGGI